VFAQGPVQSSRERGFHPVESVVDVPGLQLPRDEAADGLVVTQFIVLESNEKT
jgi:hypothetical protein